MSAVLWLEYEKERLKNKILNYIDNMGKADDEFKAFSMKMQTLERKLLELNDALVGVEFDKDKQELLNTAKLTREFFTFIRRRLDDIKNNGDENLSSVNRTIGALDEMIQRTPPHLSASRMICQIMMMSTRVDHGLLNSSEILHDLIIVQEDMLVKLMLLSKHISARDIDYEYLNTDSLC